MPDSKKKQERDELHRAIFVIVDDLRGRVDGWDFKNYVLCIRGIVWNTSVHPLHGS